MNLLSVIRATGLAALCTCLPTGCESGKKDGRAAASSSGEKPATETFASDAFLILPGDYSEATGVTDLEARFGAANVRRETGEEPRVVLFPDDPTRRAYFTFHDDAAFSHLAGIKVTEPTSRWRGKHGVHVGMSVAKVRELNGKPFYYSGFDTGKRAMAHDSWSPALEDNEKQPLGNFDVAEGDHLYFELEFGIAEPSKVSAPTDLPSDEHLSSDDPRFPKFQELAVVTAIMASSSLDDEW
jgi:hypothetical protein